MNKLKIALFVSVAACTAIFFASCKKKGSAHKVVFKAEASSGGSVDVAVYGYDANTTTASSLTGTTWSSPELNVPAGTVNANVVVNGQGNSTSTLKVQIYVDGVLKKEGTSSGQVLSASANYQF
ncbi:hypothetical protein DBR32_06765 [Taibaiella sp. KBW10]|uniref:hypothetical protein n=1 Tax=Taibaiella sp. KBW10 TaxID=2153357 RepID=UPI000F597B20|nr:hypothetical protein [Taibaiella sp. KBW10]RQO31648.1 hypothetical protein DBR32_06765 [Taibaiella sp. KBW10]